MSSDAIYKAIERLEYANKIVNTMELKLGHSYYQGVQSVLGVDFTKPGQLLDLNKLDSLENQRKLSKFIANYLTEQAANELGVDLKSLGDGPEGEFKKAQLLQSQYNITEQILHRFIKERGSRFTYGEFMNIAEQLKRAADQSLKGIATQHIGIEHLEDLTGFFEEELMGAGKFDVTKGLDLEEAVNLLDFYVKSDMSIPKQLLKNKEYFIETPKPNGNGNGKKKKEEKAKGVETKI